MAFRIKMTVLLLVLVVLAAFQGDRVQKLREAELFYRWILAAGANERLFADNNTEYADKPLFEDVSAAFDKAAQNAEKIDLRANEQANDKRIWAVARSEELKPQRQQFLTLLHGKKLMYAKNIDYAQAEAGGVNVFNLFFGFRRVAANFVWLQVDRFWHQGMMYRMIPLMRTCVALDPNFVEAYLLGSWHLAYNVTAKMVDTPMPLRKWSAKYQACVGEKETYYYLAIDFLKDGVRNNPRNYKLYFDLGFSVYKNKLSDFANAVKYLSEAVRQPHERWVPRQLYICEELNGQYEDALAGWQDYENRFKNSVSADDTAPRFIKRNQALIYEKQMDKAKAEAQAATDPAIAEAKKREAGELKHKALDIWSSMPEGFATYRLARLNAADLAEQSRYLEAIAILDKARWDEPSNFDEISDIIMDLKQKGNIPLSVSERKAILRKQEGGVDCPGKPKN
jgi:hypothetical protein